MRFCQLYLIFSLVYLANGGPVKRNVPLAQGMSGTSQDTQIGTEQGAVSVAPNNENTNNNNIPNNGVVSNAPIINGDNNTPNAVTNGANADASNTGASNTATASQGVSGASNTATANQGVAGADNTETAGQGIAGVANTETANQGTAGGTPTVDAKLDEDHQVKPVAEKGELQQTRIHPGGEVEKVYTGTPDEVATSDHKGVKQPLHTVVKPNGEIEKVYVGTPTDNKKILNKDEKKVMKEATATLAHDTFNISIPLKPRKPPVIKFIGNETEGVYVKSPASENFKTICVMEHNKKRLIHNAHPLVWSDKLAESAQTWADHLAEIDDDLPDTTNRKYGENIFWTRPQLPEDELCKAAVDEWYNEVKLYDFSASHKRNYDADPVNEFTQLVYDGQTREVGVAFSLSRSNKQYVVARYHRKRNSMMLDSEIHPAHSDRSRVRFDRPVFQTYNMIIRVPRTSWVPQYKQPNSPAFQRLESKMKNAFKATFQESPTLTSLVDFKLNTFKLDDRTPGSSAILADLDLKFYPYVKDPIQRLRSSVFHGQLNGMELDDNFLKVFNKTGVYVPPSSWKDKMEKTDLQADLLRPPNTAATDPITGAPTKVKYPQPISEDIDLLDRKPCQGGICETYLIKDRSKEAPTNASATTPLKTVPANATLAIAPPPNGFAQPCCNQMPPPQPCLALACPPPSPMPACNPNCRPRPNGMWPSALYRRGGIAFENHKNKHTEYT